jgi:serine protease inhibitor
VAASNSKKASIGLSLLLLSCQIAPAGPLPSGSSASPSTQATAESVLSPSATTKATPIPIVASRFSSLTSEEFARLKKSKLLDGYNKLGFEMLHFLSKDLNAEQNLLFSPMSIAALLTLLYQASTGETRTALGKILAIEGMSNEQVTQEFELLKQHLGSALEANTTLLNSLWSNAGQFEPLFFKQAEATYEALFASVPSLKDREIAIQNWIKTQSQGQFGPLELDTKTDLNKELVLLTALSFSATWNYPFYSSQTLSQPFQTASGKFKPALFMHINPDLDRSLLDSRKSTTYSESLDSQALGHHLHSGFEVLFFLPKFQPALSWAKGGTYGEWFTLKSSLKEHTLGQLFIPLWQQTHNHNLEALFNQWDLFKSPKMGDLSQLISLLPQGIKAFHGAHISINERGVNTMVVRETSQILGIPANPIQFKLDRPFFYTVHDQYTNAILYMGIVNDPTQP